MRRWLGTAAVLAAAVALSAGCGGGPDPVFDAEGGADVACMVHQAEPPGPRYTDPERRDSAQVFGVLRYYTAHGRKGYCDGAGPTEADRAWMRFYVEQGADRASVSALLDG